MKPNQDVEERTVRVQGPVFGLGKEKRGHDGRAWRPFFFERLERVSKVQALLAQKLDYLLPAAAGTGAVQAQVLGRLKEIFEAEVQLAVDYVHVIRPKDFGRYLVEPTFLAILAPSPHKARGFFEVELALAHAAIDLLLGGASGGVALRPLTDIEDGVMEFVVLEMLRALAPNIEPGLPRLRLEGLAHSVDEAVAAVGEENQVVVVQFKAVLGPHTGFLRLFLPATLVGMAHPLEDGPQRQARRAAALEHHMSRLAGVKTWLRAEIGRAEISSRDLSELNAGDVVLADEITARTDRGEGGTARLRVGLGRVGRMDAEVVVDSGRYKAKIVRFVLGDAPRDAQNPSQGEEEAADSMVAAPASAGVDGPADGAQDAGDPETNPERRAVEENAAKEGADLLNDIPLQIAVELARIPVSAEEVVSLKVGQVIDLNRVPGEPVELSVNGKVVARGELVEVEGHLGVRILSLAG